MPVFPVGPSVPLRLLYRRTAPLDNRRRSPLLPIRSFLLAVCLCGLSAVAPAAAIAGKLDQQQINPVRAQATMGGPTSLFGPSTVAQVVTPGLSGVLDRVDLHLARVAGASSGPLTVEIRNATSGIPGVAVMASASVPPSAVLPLETRGFVPVTFASPAAVVAGTPIAIVTYAGRSDRYVWGGTSGPSYTGGDLLVSLSSPPTTPWLGFAGSPDGSFKTYVAYAFSGFFRPVANAPAVNAAKAGRAVPVKFSLDGDQGLGVLAADSPTSQRFDCDADEPIGAIEETSAANHGLTYDPLTDRYTYIWKTVKAWRGQCRTLTIRLDDGTTHTADFQFK